jgi:DNA repair ATPase RecN
MELSLEVNSLLTQLNGPNARLSFIDSSLKRDYARVTAINAEKVQLLKAVGVIDQAITIISANGIEKIEQIVSNGMRVVFDNPNVGLRVEKKEGKRGNSFELTPYKLTPDGEVSGPAMETFGGGVVNVIAFLLRVIMATRFKRAKLLVLDEAFNNVADVYLPRVSQMLRDLAHTKGYNIYLITHQPILANAADHTYRISGEPGGAAQLTLEV